jgi:hypothetical protein
VKAIVLGLAAAIALLGAFMIVVGLSGLEADYVEFGELVGRDTPEPRVGTVPIGIGALVFSGVLVLGVVLTR